MKEVKLDADWINTATNTIKEQISVSYSENINLKKDNIWKCIRKKRDWTSPGKDKITNFWLKTLCSIHEGLAIAISEMINKELPLPSWLVEGRTILIPKNDNPGASEYQPITCLNVMYKAITGTIKELLPSHLLQVDQRGGRVDTKGCIDNLLIDKTVAEDAKINHKNLSMVWIDIKKAFDSVSHE